LPMWSRCRSSFHSTIHLSPTTGRLLNPGKAGSGATLWSYRTSAEPISRTTCGSPISVAWRMAVDRSVSSYERQKDWSAVHLIARFRSHEARIRSIETDPPNERLGSNRCISNLSEYLLKPRSSRASCHSVGEPTPIRQRCRVSFRGANPQPPHARGLPGATLT